MRAPPVILLRGGANPPDPLRRFAPNRGGEKEKGSRDGCLSGAENGARTRDLNLGKVALYQLSYFRKTLLLSVGIAKIDTFFETPKLF